MSQRVSMTNPFDDTAFAMRVVLNSREYSSAKVEKVRAILAEFDEVMTKRNEMGIQGLQNFPKGKED